MALPITAFPMAQSDKSAEYEQMQNASLLRSEEKAKAQQDEAAAIAQLPGKLKDAYSSGMKEALDFNSLSTDAETLSWLMDTATSNAQSMREYARQQLGLSDSELSAYDPAIRMCLQNSKKTRDRGPILEFYKMIDDQKAAKESAKQAANKTLEERQASGLEVFIANKALEYKETHNGTYPDYATLIQYASSTPEGAQYMSNFNGDDIRLSAGAVQRAKENEFKDSVATTQLIAKTMEEAVKPEDYTIARQIAGVVDISDRLMNSWQNSALAVEKANAAGEKASIDTSDTKSALAEWWDNAVTRGKIFGNALLGTEQSSVVGAITRAALPKNVKDALLEEQAVSAPVWQLIVTHLRNVSGAAVTSDEYKRFSEALGLSSASPDARESAIAYFAGVRLAALQRVYENRTGLIGKSTKDIMAREGIQLPRGVQDEVDGIKAAAASGNTMAKKIIGYMGYYGSHPLPKYYKIENDPVLSGNTAKKPSAAPNKKDTNTASSPKKGDVRPIMSNGKQIGSVMFDGTKWVKG